MEISKDLKKRIAKEILFLCGVFIVSLGILLFLEYQKNDCNEEKKKINIQTNMIILKLQNAKQKSDSLFDLRDPISDHLLNASDFYKTQKLIYDTENELKKSKATADIVSRKIVKINTAINDLPFYCLFFVIGLYAFRIIISSIIWSIRILKK